MWPWQHPPSTRSPCQDSLPPGLSAWWPPSSLSALTLRTGTAQRPSSSTTLLHVLGLSDSQASRMLMPPPLPSSSHLCIQQRFTGHFISTGLRVRCCGNGGNQGGPAPAISELRVGGSNLPQRGLPKFPGSQNFITFPKVPAATQLGPDPEPCDRDAQPSPGGGP